MHVFEHIIATIAPHRCLSCGAESSPLCHSCSKGMPATLKCCYKCAKPSKQGLCPECRDHSALSAIYVRTIYAGAAKQALYALKFSRTRALAECIAQSMTILPLQGTITHIPTAPTRIRQRGYDQAQLIAKQLAHLTDAPYRNMFIRTSNRRQLGQTKSARQQQLHGIFHIRRRLPPRTTPIILIDDVLTTGSTVEAAAQTLQQAGYSTISACAFAWVT